MRKNLFSAAWLVMAGAAVALSSCSNDDDLKQGGNGPVQVITMTVANSGDNFGSRAADRDLYSSVAAQSIGNVKVVVYKLEGVTTASSDDDIKAAWYTGAKTIVAQKLFTDWMNGGVSSAYSNHGRQASWSLSGTDLIKEEGVYMAYAVGYNDNANNYTEANAFGALAKGAAATCPLNVTAGDAVKEIFAGATTFKVTNNKVGDGADAWTFNASLTLHRQVAGAIGYFTNIPTKGNIDHKDDNATTLRLVASGKNTKAVFAGFNSAFTEKDNDVQYVVNGHTAPAAYNAKFYGSTDNDAYEVYKITLSDWFTAGDSNNDGYLNESDTWAIPASYKIAGTEDYTIHVHKGSALAGTFLMPFQYVSDKATFQLQTLNASGEVIRYWNIRLPQTPSITPVNVVAADGIVTPAAAADNVNNYSVVRNHMYNIGTRNLGDNPGTDPDNPGTDPEDKPQDLNNETLILKVNDNWEAIHEMIVD